MRKAKLIVILVTAMAVLLVASCQEVSNPPQKATGGAEQVTDLGFKIPKNSRGKTVEQQNITDRLKVTTDPTKVLWIHLISLDGKIIKRMAVANKVTSSGKRLEPKSAITAGGDWKWETPTYNGYHVSDLLQPDGTMGDSDAYVFWFDPQHRYHQWGTAGGLGYLLTDYPIDLTNPIDEVTGMYNMAKAAYEWQKLQEEQLCKNEGGKYVDGECRR